MARKKQPTPTPIGKSVNKGGRPMKMNSIWVDVADEVLRGDVNKRVVLVKDAETEEMVEKTQTWMTNEYRAIFLTDEELVDKINLKLTEIGKKSRKISYTTFKRYKKYVLFGETDPGLKYTKANVTHFERFWDVMRLHLIQQKEKLFERLLHDHTGRQRHAWIIERKFDDWNLKHKTDNKHEIEGSIVNDVMETLSEGKDKLNDS